MEDDLIQKTIKDFCGIPVADCGPVPVLNSVLVLFKKKQLDNLKKAYEKQGLVWDPERIMDGKKPLKKKIVNQIKK